MRKLLPADIQNELFKFEKIAKGVIDDELAAFRKQFPDSISEDKATIFLLKETPRLTHALANLSLIVIDQASGLLEKEKKYVLRSLVSVNSKAINRFKKYVTSFAKLG